MSTYIFNSNHIRINKNEDFVVIGNSDNGNWLKISSYVFELLDYIFSNKIEYSHLKEFCTDKDDELYINELINKLLELEIIIKSDLNNNYHEKLESVYISVTNRCNLNCRHCCVDANNVNDNNDPDIYNIIDKIISLNPKYIIISGGEPLIRNDILDILYYLRKNFNGIIELMTNALLINEKNINILEKSIDNISISIDGVDEESCKIIRGINIFDIVEKKIEFISDYNFKEISVSAVLPNNEYINKKFEDLNKKWGTNPIIRHFSYQGRAKENYIEIEKDMNKYLAENNLKEKNIVSWESYFPKNKKELNISGRCGGCKTTISLDMFGNIYPCNLFMEEDYKIGNILEIENTEYLEKYLSNSPAYKNFNNLSNFNIGKCSNCSVNQFCWSCPAEFKTINENQNLLNYKCNLIHDKLNDLVWG